MSNTSQKDLLNYSDEEEEILKSWADVAKCYRFLHEQSFNFFWWLNVMFQIPIIVLTSLASVGSFGIDRFGDATIATMVIGSLNLFATMLATIAQFLNVASTLEGHRVAMFGWGKLAHSITVLLAKQPTKRVPVKEFMNACKDEYDRLIEVSPVIPKRAIVLFEQLIDHKDPSLIVPDICGQIRHTQAYIPSVSPTVVVSQTNTNPNPSADDPWAQQFFRAHGRKPNSSDRARAATLSAAIPPVSIVSSEGSSSDRV